MSTPVRGADGPLGYAPRWARTGSGHADTASESSGRDAAPVDDLPQDLRSARVVMPPPREAVGSRDAAPDREFVSRRDLLSTPHIAPQGTAFDDEPFSEPASHRDAKPPRVSGSGSFWKRKKRSAAFEGDTALRELRSHLASAPDQKPEPPPFYPTKAPIFAAVVRLTGVMVLAAAGALGFLWLTAPHGAPPQLASKPGGNDVALASYPPVTYRGLEAPQNSARASADVAAGRTAEAPPSATARAAANRPRDAADSIGAPSAALAPRVVVAPRAPSRVTAPLAAAEPAPAAPAFAAAVPPPAATAPLPAAPAFAAAVPPPAAPAPVAKAPVPVIAAPVWVTPPGTPQTRDPDEVASLLMRARTYLSDGDVAAARLVLRRAAERDDPQAALALGGTYDPIVLKRLGIINFYADPAQAREWYRKAAELGSPDAASRLEQLAQTDR